LKTGRPARSNVSRLASLDKSSPPRAGPRDCTSPFAGCRRFRGSDVVVHRVLLTEFPRLFDGRPCCLEDSRATPEHRRARFRQDSGSARGARSCGNLGRRRSAAGRSRPTAEGMCRPSKEERDAICGDGICGGRSSRFGAGQPRLDSGERSRRGARHLADDGASTPLRGARHRRSDRPASRMLVKGQD
jgi:hypothetical protein